MRASLSPLRGLLLVLGTIASLLASHRPARPDDTVHVCLELKSSTSGIAVITCPPISAANPFPVAVESGSGDLGGFDSGPVQVSATVNSSSHSAGQSLGGLITLPVARVAGGSGGLSALAYKSGAGSTGQVVLRIWEKSPANTTCTDNAAFVGSAVDDAFLLIPPVALTPAASAVTTGDANTYGYDG
jgi:hypothetical protein